MADLKPCPFCGGEAEFVTKHNNSSHHGVGFTFEIQCVECGATTPKASGCITLQLSDCGIVVPIDDGRGKAIAEWNRRTEDGN